MTFDSSELDRAADALAAGNLPREQLMRRVTLTVQAAAQRVTPVKTGNLRRSLTSRVEAAGERGIVGTNVVYARPVHRRKPFLEQGLANSRDEIDRLLKEAGEQFLGGAVQ
jgi:phage gpG-like protein